MIGFRFRVSGMNLVYVVERGICTVQLAKY